MLRGAELTELRMQRARALFIPLLLWRWQITFFWSNVRISVCPAKLIALTVCRDQSDFDYQRINRKANIRADQQFWLCHLIWSDLVFISLTHRAIAVVKLILMTSPQIAVRWQVDRTRRVKPNCKSNSFLAPARNNYAFDEFHTFWWEQITVVLPLGSNGRDWIKISIKLIPLCALPERLPVDLNNSAGLRRHNFWVKFVSSSQTGLKTRS